MNRKNIIVNLDLPPNKRWLFLENYKTEMSELFSYYIEEFEPLPFIQQRLNELKTEIPKRYIEEIEFVASLVEFTPDQVFLVNLQYDLLSLCMGCTAFAVATGNTILHARNLDWFETNNILNKNTCIFDYQKSGKTIFKSVGWPGFIGVFSGIKPNSFTVTLNSAESMYKSKIAYPISLLIRSVLERGTDFKEAKQVLEHNFISSDCLLLLSGTQPHEMVVIERTPTHGRTRKAKSNHIVVSNHYMRIANRFDEGNILQNTSHIRYYHTIDLLNKNTPTDYIGCFDILCNKLVMQDMTVQQMVFDNKTGDIRIWNL